VVTSVDTNILLDVGFDQTSDSAISERALRIAETAGDVIISVVTYAEIAGKFPQAAKLAEFLDSLGIKVTPLDVETAFLAGQFLREYKLRGGTRARILADFLIAAHAQLYSDRLLTRDSRFFSDVFPNLKAVAPDDL
jgi:predicted nucleic acid-binding protein